MTSTLADWRFIDYLMITSDYPTGSISETQTWVHKPGFKNILKVNSISIT